MSKQSYRVSVVGFHGTTVELTCGVHGTGRFRLEKNGVSTRYRCVACHSAAIQKRKLKLKARLIEEAGGKCVACGYSKYIGALEFHHTDASQKVFNLSRMVSHSTAKVELEVKKCVLLCSNCHRELEAGIISLGG